jgi:hypothetical protein
MVLWFPASQRWAPQTLSGLGVSVLGGGLLFFALFTRLATGPERQSWGQRIRQVLAGSDSGL